MSNNRLIVFNESGTEVDYEKALDYMEDNLKEEICKRISPCSVQQFFSAYEEAPRKRYGKWWLSSEKGLL
jgi:hypothetical protein